MSESSTISLNGSAKMVAEFFEYCIQNILFQREVYSPEDFKVVKKYGMNLLVTYDEDVKAYIRKIIKTIQKWLAQGNVRSLVIVFTEKGKREPIERWQFDVHVEKSNSTDDNNSEGKTTKSDLEIQREIQGLFRQITASVTFLPQLPGPCTFNILVYADKNTQVSVEWEDSDERYVSSPEIVQLRNFSTHNHRVECHVAYTTAD